MSELRKFLRISTATDVLEPENASDENLTK